MRLAATVIRTRPAWPAVTAPDTAVAARQADQTTRRCRPPLPAYHAPCPTGGPADEATRERGGGSSAQLSNDQQPTGSSARRLVAPCLHRTQHLTPHHARSFHDVTCVVPVSIASPSCTLSLSAVMTAAASFPITVQVGSSPQRLLFACQPELTCLQLLISIQQTLQTSSPSPPRVLHLSSHQHDRIPLQAEMRLFVNPNDRIIAHVAPADSAAPSPSSPALPSASAAVSCSSPSAPLISMLDACHLATHSVMPALERYRRTQSLLLSSASNAAASSSSSPSQPYRVLLHSSRMQEQAAKLDAARGRQGGVKRGFCSLQPGGAPETDSEGSDDDHSVSSSSASWSWSGLDDDAEDEKAAQSMARLAASPASGSRSVKQRRVGALKASASSPSLISSSPPSSRTQFDATAVLSDMRLKHVSPLIVYQSEDSPSSSSCSAAAASVMALEAASPSLSSSFRRLPLSPATPARTVDAAAGRVLASASPAVVLPSPVAAAAVDCSAAIPARSLQARRIRRRRRSTSSAPSSPHQPIASITLSHRPALPALPLAHRNPVLASVAHVSAALPVSPTAVTTASRYRTAASAVARPVLAYPAITRL